MKQNNLIDDLMVEKPKFTFGELPIYSILIFGPPILVFFTLIITMVFLYVNWFFKIVALLILLSFFRYLYIRSILKVEFYENRLKVYYLNGKRMVIPISQILIIEEVGSGLSPGSFKSFVIKFKNNNFKAISIYCPKNNEPLWKSYLKLNNLKLVVK